MRNQWNGIRQHSSGTTVLLVMYMDMMLPTVESHLSPLQCVVTQMALQSLLTQTHWIIERLR